MSDEFYEVIPRPNNRFVSLKLPRQDLRLVEVISELSKRQATLPVSEDRAIALMRAHVPVWIIQGTVRPQDTEKVLSYLSRVVTKDGLTRARVEHTIRELEKDLVLTPSGWERRDPRPIYFDPTPSQPPTSTRPAEALPAEALPAEALPADDTPFYHTNMGRAAIGAVAILALGTGAYFLFRRR